MRRYPKRLWTVAAVPVITAIATRLLAPEPHGHWSEHLAGAALKAAQLAILLVLVTMLGWPKLRVLLLVAVTVIATGIVFQVVGDYQVAYSIWRTSGNPGFGAGYTQGHDRARFGDLLVLGGGVTFAVITGVTRRVPVWLALVAAATMVIPPSFAWPAVGALLLVLYGLTSVSGWVAGNTRTI